MVDDVRVRFSAEGEQAIIKAFEDIGKGAKKGAAEASGAIHELGDEVKGLATQLVGFVALAEVVAKMHELGQEVTQTAASFFKLQSSTGLSLNTLNALNDISEKNGVSFESVSKSVTILTRNIGQAEAGSKKASAGFSELGIRVSDLKKLSPDQQFALITERLEGIDNVARRTAVGAQLMGRGFAEAQPAFAALAHEGVDEVTESMKKLGIFLDQDTVDALHAAKQASKELDDELKGVATQFIAGFAPAATKAMKELLDATTGDGVSGFKVLGEWVGKTVELIVTGFRIAGAAVAYVAENIDNVINHSADRMKELGATIANWARYAPLMRLVVPEIKPTLRKDYTDNKDRIKDDFGRQVSNALDDFNKPQDKPKPEAGGAGTGDTGGTDQNDAALGKAHLALVQAQLEAEAQLYNAQAALRLGQDKASYEQGKLSLNAYFADRADILKTQGDNELRILQQRRIATAALPVDMNDPAGALTKAADLAKLDGDIAAKRIENETKLADLARERSAEETRNQKAQSDAAQKLLTIEGKRADAARMALESDLKALQAELAKSGASPEEQAGAIGTARSQGNAKIDYDETRRNADASMSSLQTQIKGVNDSAASGGLFPAQAQAQVTALQKEALPALTEYAAKMQDLAKQSGLPELVAQADQFAQSVKQVGVATDQTGQQVAKLKSAAQDAFQQGVANFLDNIGNKADTVKDKFRDLALGIVQSLEKVAAELLSQKLTSWLFGGGDGGAPGAGSPGMSVGGLGNQGGAGASGTPGSQGSNLQGSLTNGLLSQGVSAGVSYLANNASSIYDMFASGIFMAGGGHIRGAGTGTSDSIPIMGSNGEFMVNAAAVSRPGVLPLLHAINGAPQRGDNAGIARYAAGGMIGGGAGAAVSAKASTSIINVLDPSLLGDHLATSAGRDSMVNVMSNDPGKFKGALNL